MEGGVLPQWELSGAAAGECSVATNREGSPGEEWRTVWSSQVMAAESKQGETVVCLSPAGDREEFYAAISFATRIGRDRSESK